LPSRTTVSSPGIPSWFIALFVIVGIIAIGSAIWRFSVLRQGGLNPFVAREQLEARLAQSQLLRPPDPQPSRQEPSKEQRLAEVDDLFQRGIISAEEHSAGRAKIISGDSAP
jgi:hypothetical protein